MGNKLTRSKSPKLSDLPPGELQKIQGIYVGFLNNNRIFMSRQKDLGWWEFLIQKNQIHYAWCEVIPDTSFMFFGSSIEEMSVIFLNAYKNVIKHSENGLRQLTENQLSDMVKHIKDTSHHQTIAIKHNDNSLRSLDDAEVAMMIKIIKQTAQGRLRSQIISG